MLSLHLKATMMKVSDPIMFGHAVKVYFASAFAAHALDLELIGANPNNGLGDVLDKVRSKCSPSLCAEILASFEACHSSRPGLAMVDSSKGITNLHVPSDVIIDASMPCVVRDSGRMWNKDDELEDTKCLIPDRCYATVYKATLDYCREHGQFDVGTMGHCPNVGLMAQKAQEYGSHPTTFEIPKGGKTMTMAMGGEVLMTHEVRGRGRGRGKREQKEGKILQFKLKQFQTKTKPKLNQNKTKTKPKQNQNLKQYKIPNLPTSSPG